MPRRGVLPFARISPSFVAVRSEIRTESEERERGRSYRGNLSRLTLETQIRLRREEPDTMDDEERSFAEREQTSRPRSPGQLSRFPVAARQSILRKLIARVPIADKYYSGCRTRTRNRVCAVADKMRESFDRAALSHRGD